MATSSSPRIRPVILCGGAGTRLWPLSRLDRPKPFVSIDGGETLFGQTLSRVADPDLFGPPTVVVAEEFEAETRAQIEAAGAGESLVIEEPAARGTAAAIAAAALAGDADDLLLVLPSDHLVRRPDLLIDAVKAAIPAARQGWLVTFGMPADRPETGYGYILSGEEIGGGPHRVERFVEKPDAATASRFVAQGQSWNSGMFLFAAGRLIEELRAHAPYIAQPIEAAMAAARRAGGSLRPDPDSFVRAPAQSIDHAVMEKSRRVAVIPVDMGWSDVGSWEALHAASILDEAGNAAAGDVVLVDSQDSLVRSDGPLVVGIGIRGLVVVATERSVLIVPRGESQRVREAVEILARRGVPVPPPEIQGE